MTPTVFEYQNYKKYLADALDQLPGPKRGRRLALARALQCHSAYVTRVLADRADLSPEQAALANGHLGHNADEAQFFLLLVSRARAGNAALRSFLEQQIAEALSRNQALKTRLRAPQTLGADQQALYYSSWIFGAVHTLLALPRRHTPETVAASLGISRENARSALEFLAESGLANWEGGAFRLGQGNLHLGHDSPWIARHHTNWRLRAIDSLETTERDDLHYSSVVSIHREDVPRVREILVQAIEEIRAVVRASKENCVYSYCIDLFGVGN